MYIYLNVVSCLSAEYATSTVPSLLPKRQANAEDKICEINSVSTHYLSILYYVW